MADADTTQQVTSQTPATKQKNPKRVAAGKAIAAKRKQAREAQKKAFADAVVENNRLKQQAQAEPPAVVDSPTEVESSKNVLTTTQWLSVISIVVSLAGIYYKRKEIKGLLTRSQVPPPVPLNTPVDVVPRKGINLMDWSFIHIDIPCENLTLFRPQPKLPPSAE